jgi:hypothetical protein
MFPFETTDHVLGRIVIPVNLPFFPFAAAAPAWFGLTLALWQQVVPGT